MNIIRNNLYHIIRKMKDKPNNRGFTLIELTVVMSVIAILVLLAAPRFMGKTEQAQLTKHIANISEIESASERYYIDEGDWPRLTDEAYTSEQIAHYSEEIFDLTGEPVQLDPNGNYYDIDYEALNKYVKVNNADKNNYILQNPVGKVFYMKGLRNGGDTRVEYGVVPEESDNEEEPGYSDEEIDDLVYNHDYIPVATADELNNVRSATLETYGKGTEWGKEYEGGLDKQYVQVANIDLSGYSEEGWSPIGTDNANSSFTGIYDGGNYVIRGLEVKGEGKNSQGLFGYTEGATISNVGLIDNTVTGHFYVGGLVGWAYSSTISNSYATGSVEGTSQVGGLVGIAGSSTTISNSYATGSVRGTIRVGGLVGYYNAGTIENSYSTGSVEGTSQVGGLVGIAGSSTTISNSYATGSVEGTSQVGGLVGDSQTSTISNSCATGSVEGTEDVGGLVGRVWGSTMYGRSTISNSYATGSVEGGDYVGGLVGRDYGSINIIRNSYWDIETTGQSSSYGGTGKTTKEMKQADTYSAWDTDVWNIVNGDYPKLR